MKIESILIKNFRGYQDSGDIKIDDFTAFIGKNDAGKSTILDALNIFFGNHNAKIDKDDVNIYTSSLFREIEKAKIACASKFFVTLGQKDVQYHVTYKKVASYTDLLAKVNSDND